MYIHANITTDAFLSQARTVSEIKHPASGMVIGVLLLHLRGMVVNHMSFTLWYFTHFTFHLFNDVGWGGRFQGGKYERSFLISFEASKAQTTEKLRAAVLVTANWVILSSRFSGRY